MLDSHTRSSPLEDLEPVTDAAEIRKLIDIVNQVYVAEAVQRYAVAITTATRRSPELVLGRLPARPCTWCALRRRRPPWTGGTT